VAETSYPVADGGGVNEYTYELLMSQALGSGRIEMFNSEATSAPAAIYGDSTGRHYKIAANVAYLLRGYRWESGADGLLMPLEANTSGQPRMDRAVLRLNREDYTVRAFTLKGTPSAAPAPPTVTTSTQGATGIFEMPLGRITVKSQAGTNLPAIAAADVVPEHRWLMPGGQYGYSAFRGGNNGIGKFYLEHDTSRLYVGAVGGDMLVGENGPWTKIAAAGGWANDNIYCQRVNGMTYFQCYIKLNVADRPASTDLLICTLPGQFRPQHDFYTTCVMQPGQPGFVFFDASAGTVKITAFPQTFPRDGIAVIGPVTYMSTGVRS
jgi:hypothetical protein